jgi:NAD(P)-dependent dehydrogenase (short-subunit alcohol dehydrogenase family)
VLTWRWSTGHLPAETARTSTSFTISEGAAQAPAGIRVKLITPGRVETPGGMEIVQIIADATGTRVDVLAQNVPLGRFGDARDIAEAVAFLVSDRSQWITGSDLDVNGGQ